MLMDLPLFKGVSKDQISMFLEKTNIDFRNYEPEETVISEGEEVAMVKFIISGFVRIVHRLESQSITIEETCGVGTVFGADRLYGISTDYPYEAKSIGRTSIMQFSKDQYVNLLISDRIYMLNFFNFLSLRAQRPVAMLNDYGGGDLRSRLSLLILAMTQPASYDIVIKSSVATLAKFGAMTEAEVAAWLEKAVKAGLIECGKGKVRILSRHRFLN